MPVPGWIQGQVQFTLDGHASEKTGTRAPSHRGMPQLREQHTKRQNKHNPHPQRRAEVTNDRPDTKNGFRLVLHECGFPENGAKGQRRLSQSGALGTTQPTTQCARRAHVGNSHAFRSSNARTNEPGKRVLGMVSSARVQADEPDANRVKPGWG